MESNQDKVAQYRFAQIAPPEIWEAGVFIGKQREKTTPGYLKRNITRSSCMGNPHVVGTDEYPTAADAAIAYTETLQEQLSHYDSPQYQWFEETSDFLAEGKKIELGCCDHHDCHSPVIANHLRSGDWRRFDSIEPEAWIEQTLQLLKAHWGNFNAFQFQEVDEPFDGLSFTRMVPSSAAEEAERLEGEWEFISWRGTRREEFAKAAAWLLEFLRTHLTGQWEGKPILEDIFEEKVPFSQLTESYARIIKTGEFPMSEDMRNRQKLEELVVAGAAESEIAASIGDSRNGYTLQRFAESKRKEVEQEEDLKAAADKILLTGQKPEIKLADYVPKDWLPCFHILLQGFRFPEDVIVALIVATVGAMLHSQSRVHASSFKQKLIYWLIIISPSGGSKSEALERLVEDPLIAGVIQQTENRNSRARESYCADLADFHRRQKAWQNSPKDQREEPPEKPGDLDREVHVFYTSPSAQGIRADQAAYGEKYPAVVVRDELEGWLNDMNNPRTGASDVAFWNSAYDGKRTNERFADEKLSREVKESSISVIGGIQPRVMRKHLEAGNANGFNSRPLFFHIPRRERRIVDPTPETELLEGKLAVLYKDAFHSGNGAFSRENYLTYQLTDEAVDEFKKLHGHLEDRALGAGSEDVEAIWSKAAGQVVRYSAPIAFMRWRLGMEPMSDKNEPGTCMVTKESLQLAAKLVMAGKFMGQEIIERAQDPQLAWLDQFLNYVQKHTPKSPTKGVSISSIRNRAWKSTQRPTPQEMRTLAQIACSKGLVSKLNGDKEVRAV